MQNVQQIGGMGAVAQALRGTNIVDDHTPDLLRAISARQKILRQPRGCDLRDVLMLGNGKHFLFG